MKQGGSPTLQRDWRPGHSRGGYSNGGGAGSCAFAAARRARRPSTARTARSLSTAWTATSATSSPLRRTRDAHADFLSKATARTAVHGSSCCRTTLRHRMPVASASTRERPSDRMPAPITTPRPAIATWSTGPNATTPVDDDCNVSATTSIRPTTTAATTAQSSRIRRGTAETGRGPGAEESVTRPWSQHRRSRRLAECQDVEITGTAQREAWLARALPPVEQLRDGLWSIPVPIPHNPLRYFSVYAFALDGGGLGLLDTGWESEESWAALTGGLASIGGGVEDVRGVLVTHLHFDHLGLAARVREASGAWVAMHPADATLVRMSNARSAAAAVAAEVDFLVGLGADRDEAASDVGTVEVAERFTGTALADRLLEDGAHADFPGWRMRAVHTPGHTPGHLCFAEERTGLF